MGVAIAAVAQGVRAYAHDAKPQLHLFQRAARADLKNSGGQLFGSAVHGEFLERCAAVNEVVAHRFHGAGNGKGRDGGVFERGSADGFDAEKKIDAAQRRAAHKRSRPEAGVDLRRCKRSAATECVRADLCHAGGKRRPSKRRTVLRHGSGNGGQIDTRGQIERFEVGIVGKGRGTDGCDGIRQADIHQRIQLIHRVGGDGGYGLFVDIGRNHQRFGFDGPRLKIAFSVLVGLRGLESVDDNMIRILGIGVEGRSAENLQPFCAGAASAGQEGFAVVLGIDALNAGGHHAQGEVFGHGLVRREREGVDAAVQIAPFVSGYGIGGIIEHRKCRNAFVLRLNGDEMACNHRGKDVIVGILEGDGDIIVHDGQIHMILSISGQLQFLIPHDIARKGEIGTVLYLHPAHDVLLILQIQAGRLEALAFGQIAYRVFSENVLERLAVKVDEPGCSYFFRIAPDAVAAVERMGEQQRRGKLLIEIPIAYADAVIRQHQLGLFAQDGFAMQDVGAQGIGAVDGRHHQHQRVHQRAFRGFVEPVALFLGEIP